LPHDSEFETHRVGSPHWTIFATGSSGRRRNSTIPYQYITNAAWEAFTAPVPGIGDDQHSDPEDDRTASDQTSTITIEVLEDQGHDLRAG
jgi:hypothetical protein